MKTIYVKDFTRYPGPRFRSLGEFSGEQYREEILKPEIMENDLLEVNLDDVYGYGSSFLEEAFGRLVKHGVPKEKVESLSENLRCKDKSILEEIREYIDDSLHGK